MSDLENALRLLRSEDADEVREGAFLAGEGRHEEAVELLISHLQSGDLGVQEAADAALRSIGGSGTVAGLTPLLRSDDAPVRNLAMDILREIGNQDMEALVALLRDEDTDIRIFIADILGETGDPLAVASLCKALLNDPEVNVRYQAAVSLGELAMTEAAKCLNKAMADEEWVQFAVIEALVKIRDESSINALTKAMDDATDLVASMIVDALGEMGEIKAVPLLLRKLEESPTALRNKIVKAVVMIMGGKSLSLLSEQERENLRQYALVALEDEDEEIQDAAVAGLGVVGGEQAAVAILDLAATLDPEQDEERVAHMADALARIGRTEALKAAVQGEDWKRCMAALAAVARLGDAGLAPVLQQGFWEKDQDAQRVMAEVLKEIGDADTDEFFLEVLARHEDATTVRTAAEFLGVKRKNPAAVAPLFTLLQHPYDDVKDVALESLIAIGGDDVRTHFTTLFDSEEPIDRLMAVYALGKLGHADDLALLQQALEDPVPDIRKIALESIEGVCLELERLLPLALPRLNDEDRDVRLAVIEIVGKCEDDAIRPHLESALEDEDEWVRIRALEALGERKDLQAVARITPLLEQDNMLVTLKVVETLGAIGGEAAFHALLTQADHEDPDVQAAVEAALDRIRDAGAASGGRDASAPEHRPEYREDQ